MLLKAGCPLFLIKHRGWSAPGAIQQMERGAKMEGKKKVSLTVVILNCICSVGFIINLIGAIVCADTHSFPFVLRVFCAVGWTVCATIWVRRYILYKKENKKDWKCKN